MYIHTKQLKELRSTLIAVLGIMVIAVGSFVQSFSQTSNVYFFDIGQGDASLIMLPKDIDILIDGGPGHALLSKLGATVPWYDRTIEYMVLTHAHSDHLEGLVAVAQRYTVETFIYNGVEEGLETLLPILEDQKTALVVIERPTTITLADTVTMEFLFPDRALRPIEYEDLNDSSLVLRTVFGSDAVLFTGDAPKETERYLISKGVELEATVLQVGHHGSKTSSAEEFIEAVSPEYAIISAGDGNGYGHPHIQTLRTLEKAQVSVFRTDRDGDIQFKIEDGVIAPVSLEKNMVP